MPIRYARGLTGRDRSTPANRQLGIALAFVAGATNAGGFLAVRQYTSHMTGIVSEMADSLAIGTADMLKSGAGGLLSFIAGAACTALLVNFARRHRLQSVYALPLLVEAALLLGFGLLGARLSHVEGLFVPVTVMLLCFAMGLQNATITKLSHAEIRTTHITGIVTDIGIEFGKMLYWNGDRANSGPRVHADRRRLALLSLLAVSFFAGGVAGALGFRHAGYVSAVPLAVVLIGMAGVPAIDDLCEVVRQWKRRWATSRVEP